MASARAKFFAARASVRSVSSASISATYGQDAEFLETSQAQRLDLNASLFGDVLIGLPRADARPYLSCALSCYGHGYLSS